MDLQHELKTLIVFWKSCFLQLPDPFRPLNIENIDIRFNSRMRSRAGVCKVREKLVELNPHLLKTKQDLEETFVHEVCHMVVSYTWPYAQPHGQKWKKLMTLCGFKAQRCHKLMPEKKHAQKRWELNCACQVHQVPTVTFNKIKKGWRYKCRSCGHVLKQSTRETTL